MHTTFTSLLLVLSCIIATTTGFSHHRVTKRGGPVDFSNLGALMDGTFNFNFQFNCFFPPCPEGVSGLPTFDYAAMQAGIDKWIAEYQQQQQQQGQQQQIL
ncbi:unnamed protein product [Didymodactylos carnosus]|uniref:Uncharacterized protein n=1 Tax=Didymodactylos carnosus TaxID=1234261 RepID=A0A815HQR7_9BILA|nr:unnamed protein product [Didymodactylos carnosus]CAF1353848.1 unnamed protein product [Didymodactylos carnosus]CAF3780591.1 unnamed protein product [Didymodactylos carnosus]CAF4226152.1 unnamed protein product [Didymodactylos carnosus]